MECNEKMKRRPFPVCELLGVPVSVTTMERVTDYLENHIEELRGQYICVGNVHTTVLAFEDADYMRVQQGAAFVLPDGKPLSVLSRKRGFLQAARVAGPDLMRQMFLKGAEGNGLRHFFYGAAEETLKQLEEKLKVQYPGLQIAGMYAPPFRNLTKEENTKIISLINDAGPDIIWIGLGAPKQENWMAEHEGQLLGVMLGVGAGFDFHAGTVKRAPKWMQRLSLEWLFRLTQDPKRLWRRYFITNRKFIKETAKEDHIGKRGEYR
ncbi:MAG: WecB/TagA/CpsF family glycosyltransferase [Lachnospiraceae bacterium]